MAPLGKDRRPPDFSPKKKTTKSEIFETETVVEGSEYLPGGYVGEILDSWHNA